MSEGDLNAHPESFDEGWKHEERRYDRGGISAGKIVNWLVLVLVLVAVGYLAYGAAAAFFPRWWAEQVGTRVGGSRVQGIAYGFGVGALFTFVPLVVFAQTRRRFFNWTWRLIVALIAIALALPNWLTVAVAVGTSSAAADGRTILTSEAPGFRNGSAAGAIAGLLFGLLVVGTSMRLGHQRKKVRELKGKVTELERINGNGKPADDDDRKDDDAVHERLAEPADRDANHD
ncbi:MAG: hypothetical protein ACJ71Z_04670 [Aeromicrobium sp.]